MYVLAPNQTVEKFPYSIGELRRDNPSTSFPGNPSAELLAEWNVFPVELVAPEYDPIYEEAIEGAPVFQDGTWRQSWIVKQLDAGTVESNKLRAANFSDLYQLLLASNTYKAIRSQAAQSLVLTIACTEFLLALNEAIAGRPNKAFISAALDEVFANCTLTEEQLVKLGAMLKRTKVDALYSNPVFQGLSDEINAMTVAANDPYTA